MFVKLQTSMSGPGGSHQFGAVIEMEDAEAARFCDANLATPATDEEIAAAAQKSAAAQQPADSTPASDATPNFDKMTKAQIVAHAAEVHGLELKVAKSTKDELVAAVNAHISAAAENEVAPETNS